MRYLLSVPPFTDVSTLVDIAVDAEASAWDGFFLWDHLRWDDVQEIHDPWVLLGAIARETERMRLGTMVTPLSRRRPWVVAKQLVTLDHLSGGRAVLGVGLGEPRTHDFAELGEESDPKVRAEILDESLMILDRLMSGRVVDRRGKHFQLHASLRPASVQRPRVPVWVAGIAPNRRPLERARRWDGYVPIGRDLTPESIAALVGPPPPGWELVVPWDAGRPAEEWAAIGVTGLVRSVWPQDDGWVEELRELASAPPTRT